MNQSMQEIERPFISWRMVALGFLSQNIAIGFTFGIYGLLVKPLTEDFDINRSTASLGIALISLVMGLSAPIIGPKLDRHSIKYCMMIGTTLVGVGFLLASQAQTIQTFLAAFTLLIGTGVAMMGPLPAATLVSNWFSSKRGLAIGIVNVPLGVTIFPLLVNKGFDIFGWRSTLQIIAVVFFILLPVLRCVISRPNDTQEHSPNPPKLTNKETTAETVRGSDLEPMASIALLKLPLYWALVLFAGLLTAGSIVIITHIYPFATDYGITAQQGSILLGANGLCAMIGAISMGWLSDKFGPHKTLGVAALCQTAFWFLLLQQPRFELLLLLVIGIGMASGGTTPSFYTLLAKTFGSASFGRAAGFSSLILVPITFGAPVLAGYLFDTTHSYQISFAMHIALYAASAIFFLSVFSIFRDKEPRT